ncbi:MAG TPA: hypothetical protein VHN79_05475, partial [Lacunisphaera sp.]|nr:hypothetical protein [Lacunisphaera sp.]
MLFSRAVRRLSAFGALALGVLTAAAQTAQPDITGKDFRYDDATKNVTVTGDARLVYPGLVLTADEINFNSATRTASARGNVVLT